MYKRQPNDKAFHLLYRRSVRGNQYGRKEELYECEDCSGCPYAEKCKKTDKNRTIRINQELTAMHQEVIENLESIHGCLLYTSSAGKGGFKVGSPRFPSIEWMRAVSSPQTNAPAP